MKNALNKLKQRGLTLVLLGLFALSITGQMSAGWKAYNEEQAEKSLPPAASLVDYVSTGHFLSSVSENMESEFLQMALYVILTAFLYQRGSAESRKMPEDETEEDREKDRIEDAYCKQRQARHPVLWRLYEVSLSTVLIVLFLVFFALHSSGSWRMINEDRAARGEPPITYLQTFSESQFWFESFQNWQSEFFSIAVLCVLSIFLRQRGSSQSKRLNASSSDTGSD